MACLLSRRGPLALLLAAGILGVASPGGARAGWPGRPVSGPREAVGRSRVLEVELAWMSDPVTFRCPLRARWTPAGLEVAGRVPDGATRTRVLQLARSATIEPVVDALNVGRVVSLPYIPAEA